MNYRHIMNDHDITWYNELVLPDFFWQKKLWFMIDIKHDITWYLCTINIHKPARQISPAIVGGGHRRGTLDTFFFGHLRALGSIHTDQILVPKITHIYIIIRYRYTNIYIYMSYIYIEFYIHCSLQPWDTAQRAGRPVTMWPLEGMEAWGTPKWSSSGAFCWSHGHWYPAW